MQIVEDAASLTEDKKVTDDKSNLESNSKTNQTETELLKETDESNSIKTQYKTLTGPKKTGQTINLDQFKRKEEGVEEARKRKRKRISKESSSKPTLKKI